MHENGTNKSPGSSGCVGVNWSGPHEMWVARIRYGGKRISLGYFKDINDAVIARRNAEIKYNVFAGE